MKQSLTLNILDIPKKVLESIPARIASHYCVVPLDMEGTALRLAVPSDFSRDQKNDIRVMLGFEPSFVSASRAEIQELIAKYYGVGAGVIESLADESGREIALQDFEVIDQEKDSTIITLVNELFLDALRYRASDIHIEPFEKEL